MMKPIRVPLLLSLFAAAALRLTAQTSPPEGLRDNTPTVYAFTNVRIIRSPGKIIEHGTLVIRDGIIESVGTGKPPADAFVRDLEGLSIYPGLIETFSGYGLPKPPKQQGGGDEEDEPRSSTPPTPGAVDWNPFVRADQNAALLFTPDEKEAEKLRSQGITSALIVASNGIFKGTSALVHMGTGTPNELIVRSRVAHHITFDRGRGGDEYPQSPMGVMSLIRQTFLDADWYAKAQAASSKDPGLPRPQKDESLASLADALNKSLPVVIETSNERDLFRADYIAKEFGLDLIVRGSGQEYKRLDAVKATGRPIILPVNFPDVPEVGTREEALQVSLAELRNWDEAPENPGRLSAASMQFTLSSTGLKDPSSFLSTVRTAIERGLPDDAALTAVTSNAARFCRVQDQLGSLEKGKIADFVITDGDLFAKKTKIRETWIDGKRYVVNAIPQVDVRGKWSVTISDRNMSGVLDLKGEAEKPNGTITFTKEEKLASVSLEDLRFMFSFKGDSLGSPGLVRMSAVLSGHHMSGTGEWPDGSAFTWSGTRTDPFVAEPDTSKPEEVRMASFKPVFPPGAFGRPSVPDQPDVIFVRNATIWTSGPQGIIPNGDLLIEKGKVRTVGHNLSAPSNAVVIDGTGKHVTPGLIDPHSHMATDGGVNEAGQAISAEVRIGDFIDSDDISIYHALAGGLVAAHILHGSANPIGGQCQLIKLRWGMLGEEMKVKDAPPTIKFALGENVKQSNWGERYRTRYPQTRMGVEQIMRDEFRAARAYEDEWKRYDSDEKGIPPRRDLELDAIVEILNGKRFVHCHSYRQDEILATMRVAEDFGFRIAVFQHILEGYKVADIMAKHGAGGSTFSDWWAYKFEVYDAIPYNAAIMHDEGVLVTFNSDSDELARRLNTEAAKAVKYGGIPEEEALKFVTLNAAKQLKVDSHMGSLEPGKDADFVIWDGSPLSTYSLCEQTWIDGRRFFDRVEDRALYEESQRERATLIQKALSVKKPGEGGEGRKKEGKGYEIDRSYSCTDSEGGY